MPFAVHDGVSFHLQELGSGPPAVLLHGLLIGSAAAWYFGTAPALARSHRVLVYDLRGHGRTDHTPTGYDVATMAGDLGALTERFAEPMDLVGHSFGAVVALHFALQQPARVRRLVLVEAPLPPSRTEEMAEFLGRPPAEMAAALPASLLEACGRGGRRLSRLVSRLHALTTGSSLLADLRASHDIPDERLARLGIPTLCLYGTRSSCLPCGERLRRVIPGARLIQIDGGHFLPLEAPGALSQHITEFLDA